MYYLPDKTFKLLLNPLEEECQPFIDDLANTIRVQSWRQIAQILL